MSLQALRAWYIPILLRWHQSRVDRCLEQLRERDKAIAEDAMERTLACGYVHGNFFRLRTARDIKFNKDLFKEDK